MHVIYHAPGERQTKTANTGTVDIYQLAERGQKQQQQQLLLMMQLPCLVQQDVQRALPLASNERNLLPFLAISFSLFRALSCTT